jgi:hypothetical protein
MYILRPPFASKLEIFAKNNDARNFKLVGKVYFRGVWVISHIFKIYSNMRCILQGILVYFQRLRSSFDTSLTFNYWIGHCCKSFKKVLNFTKLMTQEPKNAKNVCEKYLNASIYLVTPFPW